MTRTLGEARACGLLCDATLEAGADVYRCTEPLGHSGDHHDLGRREWPQQESREFCHQFRVYLVRAAAHHQRGLLHDIQAPYLVTIAPSPRDTIYARATAYAGRDSEDGFFLNLDAFFTDDDDNPVVSVTMRPWRGPHIGEDGLEDAFGGSVAEALVELLEYFPPNGLYTQDSAAWAPWVYAGADACPAEQPYSDARLRLKTGEHGRMRVRRDTVGEAAAGA